jgi:amicoumacin kinase
MPFWPQAQDVAPLLARQFVPGYTALCELHHGEGAVFEITRGDSLTILKVLPATAGALETILAKLDWIAHLYENGFVVPRLLSSVHGNAAEQVESGGELFTAYAYEKIALTPDSRLDWSDADLPRRLGTVMGRMHKLAQAYASQKGRSLSREWDEADWLREPGRALHPSQNAIARAILCLRATLAGWPRNAMNYGLIHDDLHGGNVFRLGDELAIIDLDSCHYGWFAADIASALLFRVWIGPAKEDPLVRQAASRFLRQLLLGYQSQRELPPDWGKMLPYLLKLREISLFQSFYRHIDSSRGVDDPLFQYVFASISQDRPFLDMGECLGQ